ncbi:MAG: cyclase family protein [bacterium]
MTIIDLSHPIRSNMAQYPGDAAPVGIKQRESHEKAGFQVSSLELECHVATHIDTPLHFLAGQPGLEVMPLDRFVGTGLVLDVSETGVSGELPVTLLEDVDLEPVDYLLLRTGWDQHWGTDHYYAEWPYLSPELARLLAVANLKGIGLDSPSIDPLDGRFAHDLLAAAGLINVENLANLAAVPPGHFFFLVLPLKLEGAEGSPVRAVAILGQEIP